MDLDPLAGRTQFGSRTSKQRSLSQTSLESVLSKRLLTPHFQPVVDVAQRTIYGFESLIRGPLQSPIHAAEALLAESRREGMQLEIELASARAGIASYHAQGGAGVLFVNLSPLVMLEAWRLWGDSMAEVIFSPCLIDPSRLIVELTEQDSVSQHFDSLSRAFAALRRYGARIALDDYGVGHHSLQLWAELNPDLVKIDRYFFRGIARDIRRQKMVHALVSIAQCMGTPLVAEGIENAEDFECVCAYGIRYAQGWHFGTPQPLLATSLPESVRSASNSRTMSIIATKEASSTAACLRVQAPALCQSVTNDDVQRFFAEHKQLHAVAIIDDHRKPVGIINRRDFSERYAQRYTRELFGRDCCTTFMNMQPVLVDIDVSIDQLSHILVSNDQRYLLDGFVITREGRYDSLGTGEALVRSVTEMRIEAARYANPLTSMPGNIPLSQRIGALLFQGDDFVACYGDLNNFKPYNDVYGYWRGDDMILLCADAIRRNCDPIQDFVGHVGGDDFVILFRSADWMERSNRIIAEFNLRAIEMYDAQAQLRSGIEAEDRYGVPRFFPIVSLSIGALVVQPATCDGIRPQDVASAAARVKHKVKHENLSFAAERYSDSLQGRLDA
jgi:EAL domain-containing protein (putative c-di-GMP-specific phosphodiesterase class I)/GGDEF domain-containing protein